MKQDRLEYKDFEADVAWTIESTGRHYDSATNSVADWWICAKKTSSKVEQIKRKELWLNLLESE